MTERLSRRFHSIYQAEARRQAQTGDDTVRHPDEYEALPEHTKEYDRVLARDVLGFLSLLQAKVANQTGDLVDFAGPVGAWADAAVEE